MMHAASLMYYYDYHANVDENVACATYNYAAISYEIIACLVITNLKTWYSYM